MDAVKKSLFSVIAVLLILVIKLATINDPISLLTEFNLQLMAGFTTVFLCVVCTVKQMF